MWLSHMKGREQEWRRADAATKVPSAALARGCPLGGLLRWGPLFLIPEPQFAFVVVSLQDP